MGILIALAIIALLFWFLLLVATIMVYGWKSDTSIIKWIEDTYDPELAEINDLDPMIIRPGGYGRYDAWHFYNGYFVNQSFFPILICKYCVTAPEKNIESIVPFWYKSHRMLQQIEKDLRQS